MHALQVLITSTKLFFQNKVFWVLTLVLSLSSFGLSAESLLASRGASEVYSRLAPLSSLLIAVLVFFAQIGFFKATYAIAQNEELTGPIIFEAIRSSFWPLFKYYTLILIPGGLAFAVALQIYYGLAPMFAQSPSLHVVVALIILLLTIAFVTVFSLGAAMIVSGFVSARQAAKRAWFLFNQHLGFFLVLVVISLSISRVLFLLVRPALNTSIALYVLVILITTINNGIFSIAWPLAYLDFEEMEQTV